MATRACVRARLRRNELGIRPAFEHHEVLGLHVEVNEAFGVEAWRISRSALMPSTHLYGAHSFSDS